MNASIIAKGIITAALTLTISTAAMAISTEEFDKIIKEAGGKTSVELERERNGALVKNDFEHLEYTLLVRTAEEQARVREHILWSLGTSLDKLQTWDGFNTAGFWDVYHWRRYELEQMNFDDLLQYYADMKANDLLYDKALITIKELAEGYFGELQWRSAQHRAPFFDRNELFINTHYPGREGWGVRLWTGSKTYRHSYNNYEEEVRRTLYEKIHADAIWLEKHDPYILDLTTEHNEFSLELHRTFRRTDGFVGNLSLEEMTHHTGIVILAEELWKAGIISLAERILLLRGELAFGELFE